MSTTRPKPAPLSPDSVVGGYRIVRRIAAGGFGIVYLAIDKLGQEVAIKEYVPASISARAAGERVPQIDPEKVALYRLGLKSFFEEGRALAQLSHPAVVRVLNFFYENETVYMVMNYLRGATLQEFAVIARRRNLSKVLRESSIRSLFAELLQGLRVVHQHKMLHLDIKPANIFITDDDKAVLVDFGAARQVLHKGGNFVRPMYTPGFAAPEMYVRDSSLGPWTDVYGIGACIYACMTGHPPQDALQRQEKDKLSSLLERLRDIYSDNLLQLVRDAMALDPMQRPQSVFALLKELQNDAQLRYTALTMAEKVRLQLDALLSDQPRAPTVRGVRTHIHGL